MNPAHHLDRSQHHLDFVPGNPAAGDCARARAASHAVTAAAVHWHHRHHNRRRLTTALGELVYTRRVAYAHLRTFRDFYRLLDDVAGATPQSARTMIRRMRRRVSRMRTAIAAAIAGQPDVPTLEQLMADPSLLPPPDPPQTTMTMGELMALQGRPVDSARANHPVGCPGCRDSRRPHDGPLL